MRERPFSVANVDPALYSKMLSNPLSTPLKAAMWAAIRSGAKGRGLHTVIPARRTPAKTWTKTEPFQHVPWSSPCTTKGTVRFLGPTKDGKPAFLDFKKGQEHTTNFGHSLEKVVDVTDLRDFDPPTTLALEGIEWVYAPSILSEDKLLAPDKADVDSFVRGPYFDECAQLVKDRTGAARAIAYNFRHRRIEEACIIFLPSCHLG